MSCKFWHIFLKIVILRLFDFFHFFFHIFHSCKHLLWYKKITKKSFSRKITHLHSILHPFKHRISYLTQKTQCNTLGPFFQRRSQIQSLKGSFNCKISVEVSIDFRRNFFFCGGSGQSSSENLGKIDRIKKTLIYFIKGYIQTYHPVRLRTLAPPWIRHGYLILYDATSTSSHPKITGKNVIESSEEMANSL